MATWNDIANSRIDADSPLDETLFLYFRDNQIWLKDQLGGKLYGDSSDGAGSYTSGTTDATKSHYRFSSLSISAGATFRFPDGFGIVQVDGDLTLNGTLACYNNGSGGAPLTDGLGSIGGAIMDFSSQIRSGSPVIPIEGGVGTLASNGAGGGAAGMWGYGSAGANGGGTGGPGGLCHWRSWASEMFPQDFFGFSHAYWLLSRPGSGGGGNSASGDGGDAGGVLLLFVGGEIAGSGTVDCAGRNGGNVFSGGGGGGGGGIWCAVQGDVSAVTLDASGGNGQGTTVIGGQGGGGRIILLYGGSNSASTDVTKGTGNGTGQNGLVTTANVDPLERWY